MTRRHQGEKRRTGAVLGAVLLAACLGLLLAFGAVGVAADEHADNETVHEHPDEVEAEGDVIGVADWLGGRLGGMLGESAIQISEGEYERASQLIDEEFEQRLSEYVEVEGDTGRESDEEATDRLEETRETQEEYIEASEEFEETYEEYEEAVEAGDDERARVLARELQALGPEIDAGGQQLVAAYAELSEFVPVDLGDEAEAIEAHRVEILSQLAEVEEHEFVETELSVEPAGADISFVEPLVVTGEVRTVEDEAVSEGEVRVALDDQAETVRLDDDGTFTAELRPVTATVDTENASVTFEPDPASPYLGSAEHVDVTIEQVESTVEVTGAPESVAFGEEAEATGVVTVDGEPVPGLPLEARLGDASVPGTGTEADGTFAVTETVGPTPAAGETGLVLSVARSDMAVGPGADEVPVEIEETPTALSVEASGDGPGAVAGSGVLETEDGTPVADQGVQIAVDGEVIATVRTDGDGAFEFAAELDDVAEETTVTLTAVYEDPETNLGDSEAAAGAVVLPPDDAGVGPPGLWERLSDLLGMPVWVVWVLSVALAALLAYLGLRRLAPERLAQIRLAFAGWTALANRRVGVGTGPDAAELPVQAATGDTAAVPIEVPEVATNEPVTAGSFVEAARDRHAAGEAVEAIKLSYTAARRQLGPQLADGTAATHWEFYRQCERLTGIDLAALERLTERYERATFAPTPTTPEDAATAIAAATAILEGTD